MAKAPPLDITRKGPSRMPNLGIPKSRREIETLPEILAPAPLVRRKRKSNGVGGLPLPVVEDVKAALKMPTKLRLGTAEEEGFAKLRGQIGQWCVEPPWLFNGEPFPDGSVEQVFLAFYLHRLSVDKRHAAMNECFRVLKPGGQVMIVSPYWSSRRSVADPLGVWPPMVEESFYVYSKAWRKGEELDDYLSLKCDFASVTPQGQLIVPAGHIPDPDVAQRNEEYRQHASRHFVNSVWELHVTLTKVG